DDIYAGFLGDYSELKTFFHGHTYTGNPLACASAIANIDLYQKENILAKIQPKITELSKGLKQFKTLEHVGEIRQKGLMVGIELVKNRLTKQPYPVESKIGIKVIIECRKRGLIIRPLGNVIVIMPPLSISLKELNLMLQVIYASIQ